MGGRRRIVHLEEGRVNAFHLLGSDCTKKKITILSKSLDFVLAKAGVEVEGLATVHPL